MDTILLIIIFVIVSFLAALEPGPGFIKLTVQTKKHGIMAGIFAALGMYAGAFPYIFIVALGLDVLIQSIPGILIILKYIGGAYLLWLAFTMAFRWETNEIARNEVSTDIKAIWRSFRGGFALVLLNPRTLLFYSTFLLLFLQENAAISPAGQILAFGTATATIFLLTDVAFVCALKKLDKRFSFNERLCTTLKYFGISALTFFGLRLILNEE